jgi:D-alanine-D-alanine ligase
MDTRQLGAATAQGSSEQMAIERAMPAPRRRAARVDELEKQIERLIGLLRIAVIFGGAKEADGAVIRPTINTRPWKSYESVAHDIAAALRRIGFRHVELLPEDMRLGERLRQAEIHMAWLNTGGVQGYNPVSHAAAALEMLGVPYVGHDPLSAGILDNKHIFKRDLTSLGIATAPFVTWHPARGPFRPEVSSRFIRAFRDHWGSFVVKPVSGRASLHVHVVEDTRDVPDAVAEVFEATENEVMIEAYLPGREFCIAACGPLIARQGRLQRLSEPFTFAAIERRLAPGEAIFTSMDERLITGDRFRVLDAMQDAAEMTHLRELAREVFIEFNLETLIRLDVRADANGKLFVLEANPKPDLKAPTRNETSLVGAGLAEHGMVYEDLILSLFADRLDRLLSRRRGSVCPVTAMIQPAG